MKIFYTILLYRKASGTDYNITKNPLTLMREILPPLALPKVNDVSFFQI